MHDYLGVKRFEFGRADTQNRIGEVTGLAWTEVGGDLLTIETASVPGKGKLSYTGSEPVNDHAEARLRAVKEAAEMWPSWQKELADGSLAAQGCIDIDEMTLIGQDPFLRQKYALDVKKTVETERWVTSWLSAGGSLTE